LTRDPRYDVLFEPVAIGPVTAPNRFYQVPHCNGFGHVRPKALAAMREVKAEGGWGVICTEEVEIHPTSEISPYAEGRIWDDRDIPSLALMTDAVHAHGSLAGIELTHNGLHAPNRISRVPPMAPSALPVDGADPVQARAMTLRDIKNLRDWHRDAALRAKRAGFDIVYVYAGHSMSTPMHFMQRRYNTRTDAYGGSLENRIRLTRELLETVKDAVGDTCAVAMRLAVDELMGDDGIQSEGEGAEIVSLLAELPDLWDVNVSDWSHDSATARFEPDEGYQDRYTSFVKSLTTKPVVGVGRYTSVDAMVSRINRGQLDFIGAARPSIADPFLPAKIERGDVDDIRECIGCNMCVAGDNQVVPMRCTQNPTVGEEWRRGWHPEKIEPAASSDPVLVVGAGPAGLECAMQLGKRGYEVTLCDSSSELGGRINNESRLPGLSSYARVRDYRMGQLHRLANVKLYAESRLTVDEVIDFGAPRVVLATGSKWRRDGVGRAVHRQLPVRDSSRVFSPDDLMQGRLPSGKVLLFDDDHYIMGPALAELLASHGCEVTLVTPDVMVSRFSENTLEQVNTHRRLLELGVTVVTSHIVRSIETDGAVVECALTGSSKSVVCDATVLVTAREPVDDLETALRAKGADRPALEVIGDCLAPGSVASAVYLGHLAARCFDGEPWDKALYRREIVDDHDV